MITRFQPPLDRGMLPGKPNTGQRVIAIFQGNNHALRAGYFYTRLQWRLHLRQAA